MGSWLKPSEDISFIHVKEKNLEGNSPPGCRASIRHNNYFEQMPHSWVIKLKGNDNCQFD